MRKFNEFDAPLILGGLTLVVVGAATVATYRVGMEVSALPLAFLFTVGYVAALAGTLALIRKRFGRLEGSRSGKWSGGVIRRERRFGTGRLIAGNRRMSDRRDWHRHINYPSADVLGSLQNGLVLITSA